MEIAQPQPQRQAQAENIRFAMDGWLQRLVTRAERKETFRSESALHEACYSSVPPVAVQHILRLHPEANWIQDENGRIPLHWALTSKNQHEKARLMLQFLLATREANAEEGTLPPVEKMMMIRNDLGYTALDHACCTDAPADIIKEILAICPRAARSINHRRSDRTVLHMLLEYNKSNGTQINTATVLLLLKAFPEAVAIRDRFGNLPLHYACYSEVNFDAFELLLNASIQMHCLEEKNELGHTPLHVASMNDVPVKIIDSILKASPASVTDVDNGGNSPLHLAFAHRTTVELKSRLIFHGGEGLFGMVNDRGLVPLQQGVLEDVFGILRFLPYTITGGDKN